MFSVSCQFFPTPVYPTQTTQTHLITNYRSGIPLHLENGQENERRAKMAKIIAVMNEKGGVGKSATATTLAYLLAKRGKRTALIDFDGQGHSSIIYGVKNINKLEMTINALLRKIMEDEPLPEPDNYVIKEPDL